MLHTVVEPAGVVAKRNPKLLRVVTVFCSVRNAKSDPTVCSVPPGDVTKAEYVCAGIFTVRRK